MPEELPPLEVFGRRPREALMWVPRAVDVARLVAVCRAAGPRVVDVGAGSGLLAFLLEREGVAVRALDPLPGIARYHEVERAGADALEPCDVALVSWMEAGHDYRAAVADSARVIVNVYDVEGGCGVMGAVDFAPLGFTTAASWRTASFEDVEFALDRRGRGLQRAGWPGNRVDVLTREPELVPLLARAVDAAQPLALLPWEREMDALRL